MLYFTPLRHSACKRRKRVVQPSPDAGYCGFNPSLSLFLSKQVAISGDGYSDELSSKTIIGRSSDIQSYQAGIHRVGIPEDLTQC